MPMPAQSMLTQNPGGNDISRRQAAASQTPTLGVSFKCGPPIQLNQGVLQDNPVGIAPSTYQFFIAQADVRSNPKQVIACLLLHG